MFEYHGWITVQGSAGEDTGADSKRILHTAESMVLILDKLPGLADVRKINGTLQAHFGGCSNQRRGQGQLVVDIFIKVGEVAPGSYGVLHFRDDADTTGRTNQFQVLVMRRGLVTAHHDELLSPCAPLIEDVPGG
ncbi:MAG: hypothetical protein J2P18_04845 [Nocardia sp.]|nr:hypothetical protein [Nocardia sp.]